VNWDRMKYTEVDLASVPRYARDDHFVFEQKFDGTGGMAVITHDKPVWWPGRGGRGALAHTAATQHFRKINPVLQRIVGGTPGLLVLDGEIMLATGEYHVWDVPYMRFGGVEVIRHEDDYATRRSALDAPDLRALLEGTPVKIVRQARTTREKHELWDTVQTSGAEGIMVKDLRARYEPGKRVTHTMKAKITSTADVIVLTVNRPDPQHGSATLGVTAANGSIIAVGACSLIGKPQVAPGDVIEVKFLNWTGAKLYQPRMMRLRPDKAPHDCDLTQFRAYSRETV